ncbi:MAG: aminotransferase class V-fold PLP-dependent enzyme [Cyclobacteriaceae bacterium]
MKHQVFLTPGPSQLFYTVEDHMKSAFSEDVMSISHRSKQFEEIFAFARIKVAELLNLPDGYDIYFTSSANEVWERIIQNLVGSHSHHFVNGSFSEKFFQFSKDYQKDSTSETLAYGDTFSNFLIPDTAELISITLNETSIGYSFDQKEIAKIREEHPDKLIALDGVSTFPSVNFDFNLVDTAYFSVQKCFGLPSGLGVWIVNQKCYEKAQKLKDQGHITGSYHDLLTLRKSAEKNQTPETPNTLGIYLLGKVANDMIFKTAKLIQNDTIYKAALLYQAIAESENLKAFIEKKENQSKTVVVAHCENGNSEILELLANKGWIVGKGYGKFKNDHIRIANFPTHSKELIEQIADVLRLY